MGKIKIEQFLNYKKIKDVQELITDKQYGEINKVIQYYNTNSVKNRLQNIRDFIINGVDDRWLGRLRIITKKLKNDVLSEYSCKIRYGDKWREKRDILKDKVKMDKNNFIMKYGVEEGVKRWEERNKKTVSYGLEPAILRYGEEEGKKRWEETLNRKINTMIERKKIRPYRNGRSLTEYQQKYGVEIGYKKWNDRNDRQKYRFSLNYYIDKYGEKLGRTEWELYCNEMCKTSLESFVLRYGEDVGKERYKSFIERLKFVQSEGYYIEKYGEKEGLIKYKESLTSKISYFKDSYSKISQDLFWEIYQRLYDDNKKNCYFYELNNEYTFYVWENTITIIKIDFKLGNKIIEFDGDYWHSKPEQIEKDKLRDGFLTKKGYVVKRVKENEYRMNKKLVIEECLNFLKTN